MSKNTISQNNPAYNTNPPYAPFLWTNYVTGELFVCIDNTKDKNVWQGQAGTLVNFGTAYPPIHWFYDTYTDTDNTIILDHTPDVISSDSVVSIAKRYEADLDTQNLIIKNNQLYADYVDGTYQSYYRISNLPDAWKFDMRVYMSRPHTSYGSLPYFNIYGCTIEATPNIPSVEEFRVTGPGFNELVYVDCPITYTPLQYRIVYDGETIDYYYNDIMIYTVDYPLVMFNGGGQVTFVVSCCYSDPDRTQEIDNLSIYVNRLR